MKSVFSGMVEGSGGVKVVERLSLFQALRKKRSRVEASGVRSHTGGWALFAEGYSRQEALKKLGISVNGLKESLIKSC